MHSRRAPQSPERRHQHLKYKNLGTRAISRVHCTYSSLYPICLDVHERKDWSFRASPSPVQEVASEPSAAIATPQSVEPVKPSARIDDDAKRAQEAEDASRLLQDQKQTIALLVSEKMAVTEALERLEGVDSSTLIVLLYRGGETNV